MNKPHLESNSIHTQLINLASKYCLTAAQTEQLMLYMKLLVEWNEKFNLTAITDPVAIIEHHFNDSLALSSYIDFSTIHTTADIGTGAGFPGIPLKIMFPHLTTILIEVNNKKRSFLAHVIQELSLQNVALYEYDWRTFLRSTQYPIDYFFARASLQPEELVRIFKSSSPYQQATLVYWASKQWLAKKAEAPFIFKEIAYTLDTIQRKFIFFKQKK
ncbi:MAG TPA: 16S rRNA (guanine(527)-N(7))-methyltransferase RsmG [Candidatus Babeliales bacterium]|nr:16S rRNA (guanine(527)-N(7))-methyltransferase RsmG [Candidatus Babeliales bacterium]